MQVSVILSQAIKKNKFLKLDELDNLILDR